MTRHIASERTGVYQIVSPPNAAASVSSTALCSTRPRPTEMLMAGTGRSSAVKKPPMTMLKPRNRYETL